MHIKPTESRRRSVILYILIFWVDMLGALFLPRHSVIGTVLKRHRPYSSPCNSAVGSDRFDIRSIPNLLVSPRTSLPKFGQRVEYRATFTRWTRRGGAELNRRHMSVSKSSGDSHSTRSQRDTESSKNSDELDLSNEVLMPPFLEQRDAKHFNFTAMERKIYNWWEKSGFFKPQQSKNTSDKRPFVVPMPPPNVTGSLHMGHAIFAALQDIIVRFHRMTGRETLWIPGTDHAGIATQLLVERKLKEEGISKDDIGREQFVKRVWEWKDEKGGYITQQLRRLGASADWSKEQFTLDRNLSEAVTEAFIQLYEKGLIYRGEYMVNWSPQLQTAVSDLEVDFVEEMGKMYYCKYELEDSVDSAPRYIPVATTRPETILGDTAVCVHPEDDRYRDLIGKYVRVPMTNRSIPVVADEYVDRTFGTGALKVTPAHDPHDYAIAKRHHLPVLNIMNKDASINNMGGDRYEGLSREDCRVKLWEDIVNGGLSLNEAEMISVIGIKGSANTNEAVNNSNTYRNPQPHVLRVPRSQRGGEIVEPMISNQWFVNTSLSSNDSNRSTSTTTPQTSMSQKAIRAVQEGKIKIYPERYEKIWYNWLNDNHDWCISRQLWWGHQIPVYYVKINSSYHEEEGHSTQLSPSSMSSDDKASSTNLYVVARSLDEAKLRAVEKYGKDAIVTHQDCDVLDTWFSSGLWPFATVGWPNRTDEFAKYYPASLLETGYDILFFWVARMVMLGMELTDTVPFSTIYLHGLVRDGEGKKMSKTTGNVIDPIDTIESLGCDALRFSLVTGTTPGQDIPLSMEKVESNRNFVNKLWNAGKYVLNCVGDVSDSNFVRKERLLTFRQRVSAPRDTKYLNTLTIPEKYILSKCHKLVDDVTNALESYDFSEGGKLITDFLWDEFADWYIEVHKSRKQSIRTGNTATQEEYDAVLLYVWDSCLRVLHPYMPFLTESLWQLIPHEGESLMIAPWPRDTRSTNSVYSTPLWQDDVSVREFETFKRIVRSIRNARAQYNMDTSRKIPLARVLVSEQRPELLSLINTELNALLLMGRIDKCEVERDVTSSAHVSTVDEQQSVQLIVEDGVRVILPLSGLIDVENERKRIRKQIDKFTRELETILTRLNSAGFKGKAPENVVRESENRVNDLRSQIVMLEQSLTALSRNMS